MKAKNFNIRDIKEMRLERHWSQEQLAEMSGLSVRTIQRIENGENAGLESVKALAAVFETTITNSDKNDELKQVRKEEEYIQKIKGFYKILAIAIFSLIPLIFIVLDDPSSWKSILWIVFPWVLLVVAYSFYSFDFFGEEWKRKMIEKKFKKQ